jgi:predicted RecA/RadA family phage recombinase
MKNYIMSGDTLDLVAPSGGVTSGKGFKVGAIIAIASVTAAAGVTVAGVTEGVFDVDSDTGAAWAAGDVVYWDDTAKVFTKTTTSNTKCGYAVAAKLSADVVGRISLSPIF